jgi:hypothetical protein
VVGLPLHRLADEVVHAGEIVVAAGDVARNVIENPIDRIGPGSAFAESSRDAAAHVVDGDVLDAEFIANGAWFPSGQRKHFRELDWGTSWGIFHM